MSENTMPELPEHPWGGFASWAPDEVAAIHAYARAYAEQEVAKERGDAERFRFLRDKAHPDWEPAGGPDAVWTLHFTSAEVWPNDFTAAVDSARARSKP